MIRRIEGLPRCVFAFEAGGRPTREMVDAAMIDFDLAHQSQGLAALAHGLVVERGLTAG